MTGHAFFDAESCGRICLVLFHSLWQMGLAAMLAWLLGMRWKKGSVKWAYWAHVAALVVGLVAIPATYLLIAPRAPGGQVAEAPTIHVSAELPDAGSDSIVEEEVDRTTFNAKHMEELTRANVAAPHAQWSWGALAPWVVGVYVFGTMMMFVRLGVGISRTERMRRRATLITTGTAATAISKIAKAWRLRGVPLVAQAERIAVPTVIGLVRPMILVPATTLTSLTEGELELILAHELAHVRRLDLWVNLLQRLGEVVLFFNPAMWYLSRRISTLREYCCDEMVCTRQGQATAAIRMSYAAALLRVVELARPSLAGDERLAGLAASGRSASELRRRISRLLGESVREPLRISRGGLAAVAVLAGVFAVGLEWTKADGPVVKDSETANKNEIQVAAAYPPPETDADRVVAAAQAQTFGTEKKSRLKFRLTYWNSDVPSMRKEKEDSLELLFAARGKPVNEEQRRYNSTETTWAWDGDELFKGEERWEKPAGGRSDSKTWEQARYWDGHEAWLSEGKPPQRNVVRYNKLAELFEHGPSTYEFPQIAAAGGRIPWQGPELVMEQQENTPAETRYKLVGSNKIDDVVCDVYEGPARQERVWIDKSRGVVKAVCEYFLHGEVPNYYTEIVKTIAGRTFQDGAEYAEWAESQPADVREKLSVFWSAANFAGAEPGNLSVFSDYRDIAPGIHWPTRCRAHRRVAAWQRKRISLLPRRAFDRRGRRKLRDEGVGQRCAAT